MGYHQTLRRRVGVGIIGLLLIAGSASCTQEKEADIEAKLQSMCRDSVTFAARAMTARQRGASVSEVIKLAKTKEQVAIAMLTFKRPRKHSENGREWAIENFKNLVYRTCFEAIKE